MCHGVCLRLFFFDEKRISEKKTCVDIDIDFVKLLQLKNVKM